MKTLHLLCISWLISFTVQAQSSMSWTLFAQQSGVYYSSPSVTAYGYGIGTGLSLDWNKKFGAKADVNLLWGNGNLVATRFAIGYHPKKTWSPGIYIVTALLTGDKTDMLDDQGQRPPSAIWATGLRIVPLYFEGKKGYVSALEIGYGIGANQGHFAEINLLSVGLNL